MSGIDEQIRGIPKCPDCGKEPNYWVLETTFHGSGDVGRNLSVAAWLFDDKRVNEAGKYYQYKHVAIGDKRFDVKIREFTADNIKKVEANCDCRKRYVGGPIFNAVKRTVAFWLRKEGFGSEWNR